MFFENCLIDDIRQFFLENSLAFPIQSGRIKHGGFGIDEKEDERIMEDKRKLVTRFLHHNMCVVGGFMGGFAVLTKCDFLGNAQTANLIYFIMAILGHNMGEVFLRLTAVLIYFTGGFSYVFIKKRTSYNPKMIALIVDFVAILMLGLIPEHVNPVVSLYPIFFSMSFQWNCFPGEYGYTSSTIFSTNNLRQVSLSIAEFILEHDSRHLHKAGFFACSLLFFHIGVASSYFAVRFFGIHGIWFNWIYLISAMGFMMWEISFSREQKKQIPVSAHCLADAH